MPCSFKTVVLLSKVGVIDVKPSFVVSEPFANVEGKFDCIKEEPVVDSLFLD